MSRQIDFKNLTKGDVAYLEMNGRGREVEAAKARKAAEESAAQEASETVPPAGSEDKDPSGLGAKSETETQGERPPPPAS